MTRPLLLASALATGLAIGGAMIAAHAPAALDRWYDRSEGLGEPCDPEPRRAHAGPGGFVLDIPACWTIEPARSQGVAIHRLRDPAPGLGDVALVAVTPADTERWNRLHGELERKLRQHGAGRERLGSWQVVRLSYTARDPRSPWRYDEWHIHNQHAALSVTYRVQKVFAGSFKVARMLDAIERLVRSLRYTQGATDVEIDG